MFGRSAAVARIFDDAVDLLEQARDQSDDQVRRRLEQEALAVLGEHRLTRKVAPRIGQLLADDDPAKALEMLRKLREGFEPGATQPGATPPGATQPRAKQQKARVLKRGCLGLVIPFGVAAVFVGSSLVGDDRPEALRSLEACQESRQALGTPVEVRWLGFPPGGGPDANDQGELARRAMPVQGSAGAGRYTYLAEKTAGAWAVRHGALEVDGQHLMVVPCGGTVSESDAGGLLGGGFHGAGRVRDAEGSAPVQPGTPCTVEVHKDPDFPNGVTYNCRVVVTCGGTVLYGRGSSGYVFCSVRDGTPATAVDADGSRSGQGTDPMLFMDLPGNEVQVADDAGWSITIELQGDG